MKMMKVAAAGAMCLLLWGCFLSPGKFNAALDLRRDGSFTYRYTGEILLMTPHSVMNAAAEADTFDEEGQHCYGALGSGEEEPLMDMDEDAPEARDCTAEELKEKRAQWEKSRAETKAQMEATKAFFGGLDPSDPKTVAEFTRRLQTYQGWKRVTHKGNGVFDVDYEISGRMERDFLFPLFPEIDAVIPFVQVNRRNDRSVRVAAPGFAVNEQMMGPAMMGAAMASQAPAGPTGFKLPRPEGSFTITTDGEILTNNTNDGPSGAGAAKVLKWTVGPLDKKKPEALIRL